MRENKFIEKNVIELFRNESIREINYLQNKIDKKIKLGNYNEYNCFITRWLEREKRVVNVLNCILNFKYDDYELKGYNYSKGIIKNEK